MSGQTNVLTVIETMKCRKWSVCTIFDLQYIQIGLNN